MITQSEADMLIAIPKEHRENREYDFPSPGELLSIPILSLDERENFILNINRSNIKLTKCSYQERVQKTIVLVRIDVNGPPHTNPNVHKVPVSFAENYNGKTIECPHLHLYVEGFMDKWAIPIPKDNFPNTNNIYDTLYDFFRYCNIVKTPIIHKGVF